MMDAPQPQMTRIHADSAQDYISNLPANVKDNIFLKLPIKDVVRTSILSSKWIDAWVSIPNLVFKQKRHKESELIKMVDMVLLLHQGPIKKFKLVTSCDFTEACSDAIRRWLLILSRNGIKDLEIDFAFNDGFKIPFRLISCTVLERLSLSSCCITVPSFFQGFKQLRTLMLIDCKISGITLENMDSNFPLFDHLVLRFLRQDCLRICASNLTSLKIVDIFHDICLETPKLASACIYLLTTPKHHQKKENTIRALGRFTNIRKLEISGEFLQYLATGPIPENLPAIFSHLTDISVTLHMKHNMISAALCLFENAPNLEKLHIQFFNYDQPNVESVWQSKAIEHRLFKHLKVVKLKIGYPYDYNFSLQNMKILLEFAKLVLSTTPVLEKLNFIGFKAAMDILEMLKWFPKLSKDAEIVFA